MRILAVDTSGRTGSVAILEDRTLLAEVSTTAEQTHAKRLMSAIVATLEMAGLTVEEFDGFAVTTGPGSFTGLRIGISTVKGLAAATDKPVAGVSTLDALAYQFCSQAYPVCPIIDARKGQVYTALYKCDTRMHPKKLVEDCAVKPEQWMKRIEPPCLFVGDGAVVYGELIRKTFGQRVQFAAPYLNAVRASVVATMGMKQILEGAALDAAGLAPYYIRKPDARVKTGVHFSESKLLTKKVRRI
jgi:tRNA threonylcarbamoyladenosine biosynthesis protein TsaB